MKRKLLVVAVACIIQYIIYSKYTVSVM